VADFIVVQDFPEVAPKTGPTSPFFTAHRRGADLAESRAVDALTIHSQSLDVVGAHRKRALIDFALEVTPGLAETYVARRLESYRRVASAWRGERLLAYQLIDERHPPDLTLTYLGPAFSKGGAYILIFASLVSALADAGKAFCLGVEFESETAKTTLRRLLPRSAFPSATDRTTSAAVRAFAARLATSFDHIVGLDEVRLWTRMTEPMTPSAEHPGHYQMMVVPCVSSEERVRLLQDLAAGLESFRRHRPDDRSVKPRRAVP
jgi:hypothetical protein